MAFGFEEVFVFGGYDGQKNHNELYVFDLQSMEWRQPEVLGAAGAWFGVGWLGGAFWFAGVGVSGVFMSES